MKVYTISKNQVELVTKKYNILLSYGVPVVLYFDMGGFIKTDKFWSITTSKHINKWLGGHDASIVSQSYLDNILDGLGEI